MTDNDKEHRVRTIEAATSEKSHELRGVLLAFLGAACWGFSACCVSFLVDTQGVDVPWLACTRLFVAGLLFLAIAFVRDRDKFAVLVRDPALIRQLVAYTIVAIIMMQLGYMWGIKYTNPGTTLLLLELSIPMVFVVTCFRERRLPTGIEWISIALAAAGVVSIATQGNWGTIAISPIGLVCGLMSAVANAGYILIPVRLVRECGSYITNGVAMLAASLLLAPFARPWENPAALDATGWLVFAAIVLVGTMLAYVVFLQGVKDAGTVKASLIGVFEPVSGAILSALWLGTVFSTWDLIGGACIVSMMVLVALKK